MPATGAVSDEEGISEGDGVVPARGDNKESKKDKLGEVERQTWEDGF